MTKRVDLKLNLARRQHDLVLCSYGGGCCQHVMLSVQRWLHWHQRVLLVVVFVVDVWCCVWGGWCWVQGQQSRGQLKEGVKVWNTHVTHQRWACHGPVTRQNGDGNITGDFFLTRPHPRDSCTRNPAQVRIPVSITTHNHPHHQVIERFVDKRLQNCIVPNSVSSVQSSIKELYQGAAFRDNRGEEAWIYGDNWVSNWF